MISEVDLNDWEPTEPVELYRLKQDTLFTVPDINHVFLFDHVDGMYSVNWLFDGGKAGDLPVHFAAWTMVTPLKRKE